MHVLLSFVAHVPKTMTSLVKSVRVGNIGKAADFLPPAHILALAVFRKNNHFHSPILYSTVRCAFCYSSHSLSLSYSYSLFLGGSSWCVFLYISWCFGWGRFVVIVAVDALVCLSDFWCKQQFQPSNAAWTMPGSLVASCCFNPNLLLWSTFVLLLQRALP